MSILLEPVSQLEAVYQESAENILDSFRVAEGVYFRTRLNIRESICHIFRCGKLLINQRDQCRHGEWEQWLERYLIPAGISRRTIFRYIELTEAKICYDAKLGVTVDLLDITQTADDDWFFQNAPNMKRALTFLKALPGTEQHDSSKSKVTHPFDKLAMLFPLVKEFDIPFSEWEDDMFDRFYGAMGRWVKMYNAAVAARPPEE